MLLALIDQLRCRIGHWFLRTSWDKRIAIAKAITPDVRSLIAHRKRRPPPLRKPPRSHLIYHQSTVDPLAAKNSIETIAPQIPLKDEVLFLDVGGELSPDILQPFSRHAWRSYVACNASHPEERSYTHGLNLAVPSLKGAEFVVWRTDYVYPADLMDTYAKHLARGAWFAVPYAVRVGHPEIDSRFVREHWDRVMPFDAAFWETRSNYTSLYETQDPALFAIRREIWDQVDGLNHELWGYGWQFAEFARRVATACPAARVAYFGTTPPLHQTHAGSQMHQPADRRAEAMAGVDRLRRFLGSEAAYQVFSLKDRLPPRPPA